MTPISATDPRDDETVPDGTSLMAFLHILRKAHIHLVGPDKAHERFRQVITRGHARTYIKELMQQLRPEREKHRQQRASRAQPYSL
ncbi:MAG TPA: hypothetical protein VNX00_05750 [Herbaspirillum sp.]|jgi:hypothetical protein|nr:hypothetical protein [Herbaspirillum sp.]